jgi:hypothetical protein
VRYDDRDTLDLFVVCFDEADVSLEGGNILQPPNPVASISNLILPSCFMMESICGAICRKSSAFSFSGTVSLTTPGEMVLISIISHLAYVARSALSIGGAAIGEDQIRPRHLVARNVHGRHKTPTILY